MWSRYALSFLRGANYLVWLIDGRRGSLTYVVDATKIHSIRILRLAVRERTLDADWQEILCATGFLSFVAKMRHYDMTHYILLLSQIYISFRRVMCCLYLNFFFRRIIPCISIFYHDSIVRMCMYVSDVFLLFPNTTWDIKSMKSNYFNIKYKNILFSV